ncbi:MAG: hypothetical protein K0R09_3917 [Clostridiales bacterium]|jgi:hypothetical protein|nr:hypothetical protein [Clostridiales bacterium]
MINIPYIDNFQDVSRNTDEASAENYITDDYNENLTEKLGGNYAKIIEFYDSKL